jgi:quercetin dioxygenase-like cupin family protein
MPLPRSVAALAAVLLCALVVATATVPAVGWAQEGSPAASPDAATAPGAEPLIETTIDDAPLPPAFVRLLRITMEPGSSVPRRSHPGPKVDRVESGTLTVLAEGPTTVTTADGAPATDAPVDEAFTLTAGQTVTLPAETVYSFRNDGDEAVELLTVVILPAGHQRPPGISYPDGDPPEDAYEGVANQVLGDGVATLFPGEPLVVTLDRLTLGAGEPIPAAEGPVMLSLGQDDVQVTVDGGLVQVSRTIRPGPQRESEAGEEYDLRAGDALFFPAGMAEIARGDGELAVLRLMIAPSDPNAPATPAPIDPAAAGVVELQTDVAPSAAAADVTATPAGDAAEAVSTEAAEGATEEPAEEDAEEDAAPTEAAGEPTEAVEASEAAAAAPAGEITVGATVQTNDAGVNLRDSPTTAGAVVATLDQGVRLVITGPAEEGDGFTWYPVQGLDDPGLEGFVAVDFLELV